MPLIISSTRKRLFLGWGLLAAATLHGQPADRRTKDQAAEARTNRPFSLF
ncbi:MAG TPA: hypothetical protein VF646_11070 [Cytophagales bacterium]